MYDFTVCAKFVYGIKTKEFGENASTLILQPPINVPGNFQGQSVNKEIFEWSIKLWFSPNLLKFTIRFANLSVQEGSFLQFLT